jgi:hypothetical protein
MNMFRRNKKNKWLRVAERTAGSLAGNPAVKTGAGALAGLTTLTAASAAVSAARRKSQS